MCRFGEIGDVYIPRVHGTADNRGFGFVRFVDERSAEEAVKEMAGKIFDGREIQCSIAGQKRPDPPRRGLIDLLVSSFFILTCIQG